jgi:hypothetical protein
MRKIYSGLAWLVAACVVVQAASIAFGFGGMVGYVMDGGVVDKALMESEQATFTGDLGFPIHELVGGLVMPLVAFALGIVSFFVKGVRRARTLAWGTFALVFIQGSLGYAISDAPYVGLLHGANALLVLVVAVRAAWLGSHAFDQVTVDEPSTSVLA